ncbi:MAG: DUF4080 domain-containing protein [Deltaproteobacteria bacterium]|nr:MAG: DUF4080 domain-containing protein [Deltaproteobacteria bacterium]
MLPFKHKASEILLTTINARYIHAAFGLRYLMSNLGDLSDRAEIIEWTIKDQPTRMLEDVAQRNPTIVGLGVYIWNIDIATQFVTTMKTLFPHVVVVLGGPEVSYEMENLPIVQAADYVITGEADLAFAELCRSILEGNRPSTKIIRPVLPSVDVLELPYSWYTEHDVEHRVVYVEMSRGCPFRCEFCLSSLEIPVRKFPIETFLGEMQRLLDLGLQQFKFVDRTFNLNIVISQQILEFFLERYRPGLFLHFEMVPDRFPEKLRTLVRKFPPGALQFEVGIQSFDPEVGKRISRRQDLNKLEDNLTFLAEETGVHVHADLIAGLPGESLKGFGEGFDRLLRLGPQEIQVGILKRLRGTPIARHQEEWGLVFNPNAPYEILQSADVSFEEMQQMKRFSQLWDRYGNSGNFQTSLPLLWQDKSPFQAFWDFSCWVVAELGQSHSISLPRMMELLFHYLTEAKKLDVEIVVDHLWNDYAQPGRHKIPAFLRPYVKGRKVPQGPKETEQNVVAPARQARHITPESERA